MSLISLSQIISEIKSVVSQAKNYVSDAIAFCQRWSKVYHHPLDGEIGFLNHFLTTPALSNTEQMIAACQNEHALMGMLNEIRTGFQQCINLRCSLIKSGT